jgi:pimeloyl-ACP methyl ester carboxylesterase
MGDSSKQKLLEIKPSVVELNRKDLQRVVVDWLNLLIVSGASYNLKGPPSVSEQGKNLQTELYGSPGWLLMMLSGYTYQWDDFYWDGEGAGIVWRNDQLKHVLIAIRGTVVSDFGNVLSDAMQWRNKVPELDDTYIHHGFLETSKRCLEELRRRNLLPGDKPKEWRITLTGHSLGGAAAVVLAMFLHQQEYQIHQVVTFGQPMVTNYNGAIKWNGRFPLFRMVNHDDAVARGPPCLVPFLNVYYHFGEEIVMQEVGQYQCYSFRESLQQWGFWTRLVTCQLSLSNHSSVPTSSRSLFLGSQVAINYKDMHHQKIQTRYVGDYFDDYIFCLCHLFGIPQNLQPDPQKIGKFTDTNPKWVQYKMQAVWVMLMEITRAKAQSDAKGVLAISKVLEEIAGGNSVNAKLSNNLDLSYLQGDSQKCQFSVPVFGVD